MQDYSAFKDLLRFLSGLYAAEGRPGGDKAVGALQSALADFPQSLPEPYNYMPGMAEAALTLDAHPQAGIVAAALPLIRWFHVMDSMKSIGAEMGAKMLVTELVGPSGMFRCETARVGLFVQCPNLDYVTRIHSAEETYIILGGEGHWSRGGSEPELKKAGDVVFHPSNIPHSSRTGDKPTIAAWRWSGDIRYEAYACAG
ncbi:MAG: hypothetical protein GY789_18660 [Hyphomicrobiales bacterium]|nr:hypothetical protein [Hyphomicrobiales bacterium]MCP5000219.1 hypothetical protein [Hyphomicrobiales bacterium]